MLRRTTVLGGALCLVTLMHAPACERGSMDGDSPATERETNPNQARENPTVSDREPVRGQDDDLVGRERAATEETDTVADRNQPGLNRAQHPDRTYAQGEPGEPGEPARAGQKPTAIAKLKAAEGTEISGEAKLYEEANGVRIVLEVQSSLSGMKGAHIHEKGDCSDIRNESMGSHFAPHGDKHALPAERSTGVGHLGDLGNIQLGDKGEGTLELSIAGANLKPNDAMSFLGKAVVVHAGRDTGKSQQPSGGSGKPVACGVIEKAP